MTSLDDIKAGILDYEEGNIRLSDLLFALIELLVVFPVDEVLTELPDAVAAELVHALRETFDNDAPPDEIVFFSSSYGDHPDKARLVAKARDWLSRNPENRGVRALPNWSERATGGRRTR